MEKMEERVKILEVNSDYILYDNKKEYTDDKIEAVIRD